MRTALITLGTLAVTSGVVTNAWVQKKQFYPMMVYLSKSSPCMAVLYAQAFVFVILLGKLLRKIFFGQLRAAETEHLVERSWYAVTDTCLAFTMFRDDFNPRFVMSFSLLIFIKCFHWMIEDRVDYMERSPVISLLFKLRALSLLTILQILDLFFVNISYQTTMEKGASVQLVFGFEYAILFTVAVTVALKYGLHWVDLQSPNPWENKAVYMLYVELFTGFWRVILYTLFTAIMIKIHTFPLFAIRPMYLTLRQFKKTVSDIVLSRRAIRHMNTLYPDATAEELEAGDSTCIICREEMQARVDANSHHSVSKKLPCGHIFHASCLRSWFQRQQTCPTCRLDILTAPLPQTPPANVPQRNNVNQPAAQQPPIPPPFMPPPFPGMPPMPQFPQPPTTQGGTSTTSGAGTSNTGSTTATSAMPPPPPFMMPPPFMFAPPPPIPPAGYSGMSDEQLAEMEGTERKAIEARLEVLHNIRTLLDAAMVQIEQYMTVSRQGNFIINQPTFQAANIAQSTNVNNSASKNSTSETSTTDSAGPSTSTSEGTIPSASTSVETLPSVANEPKTLSKVVNDSGENVCPVADPVKEIKNSETNQTSSKVENKSDENLDDEEVPTNADELRRRRVEKLSSSSR